MKTRVSGLTVCWKCKDQTNRGGPLIKIDATNYAHKKCFDLHGKPGASNQSTLRVKNDKEEQNTETKDVLGKMAIA